MDTHCPSVTKLVVADQTFITYHFPELCVSSRISWTTLLKSGLLEYDFERAYSQYILGAIQKCVMTSSIFLAFRFRPPPFRMFLWIPFSMTRCISGPTRGKDCSLAFENSLIQKRCHHLLELPRPFSLQPDLNLGIQRWRKILMKTTFLTTLTTFAIYSDEPFLWHAIN